MKKLKVFLVKGALDGHDRGIVLVVQTLRDAGVEVVYGGLYCSPEEITAQALQEDVDMIGISMLSGAHLGVFSNVLKLLKKQSGEDWFVFGGGVIPQKDIPRLKRMGVKEIFLPGTDTKDIADFVLGGATMKKSGSLPDLIERTKKGEIIAASRLMTQVRRGNRRAKQLVSKISSPKKDTLLVGVTGPGGVGKSTLINQMIHCFRQEGKTVGVMLCDPASISEGTVLGDRVRMQDHCLDKGVFIRSLAQYRNYKGVVREAPCFIKIFGAMGKDVIIIETVGVGQKDLGFKDLVETLIFVTMPWLGDEVQLLKGGVSQTADIMVVNQADRPGAEMMLSKLQSESAEAKKEGEWQPKILKTSSYTGEGVSELVEGIKEHKKFLLSKVAQS